MNQQQKHLQIRKAVNAALADGASMSVTELIEETGYSRTGIVYALRKMKTPCSVQQVGKFRKRMYSNGVRELMQSWGRVA